MEFQNYILQIDCEKETNRICDFIQQQMHQMHRDGIIIGISGGIDSALAASLCEKSIGNDKVFGLILPEKDSSPNSAKFAQKQAEKLGIETKTIDITPALTTFGTYKKRDKFIRTIFPEYTCNNKFKISLPPDLLNKEAFNFFTLTIKDSKGNIKSSRLNKKILNGIVAATNTKHRTRMLHLYYYAELKNYLVCGTTNKSEVIQGLFVKYGDGGVDVEPIAHLYKTQVYQLSEHLGVIEEIMNRAPGPDTFSFQVSDEEWFFRMPFDKLDLLLYAWENNIEISHVCKTIGLKEEQVRRAFRDFTSKYNATKHLRQFPPIVNNETE